MDLIVLNEILRFLFTFTRKMNFGKENLFHSNENYQLFLGNALSILKEIPSNSISVILTDPPYFLSNNGISCNSGKMVSVNKGKWDMKNSLSEIDDFNSKWLIESNRILNEDGTIWIFGTHHNLFSVGYIMKNIGFKILNTITWVKKNPPPNLSCRYFTHSAEMLLWCKKNEKSKHYFNYELMKEQNNGKQMKDVWEIGGLKKSEKTYGKHPTQKPQGIIERMLLASSKPGDIILDMFCGSGTTGVVANKHNRKFIGIDEDINYLEISKKRLDDVA